MDITTLRGKETLQALTERLYGRLNGEQQQRAEMVLLEANPGLDAIAGLPIGALIAVPSVAGTQIRADVRKEDPQVQMRNHFLADLKAYRE